MRTDHQPFYLRHELRGKAIFEETREEGLSFFKSVSLKNFLYFVERKKPQVSSCVYVKAFKAKMIFHNQVTFFFLLTFPPILAFCSLKDSYLKRQGLFNHKQQRRRATKPQGTLCC